MMLPNLEMFQLTLLPEVQAHINGLKPDGLHKYLLSSGNIFNNKPYNLPSSWLAQQVQCKAKAKDKLPSWYSNISIYPKLINIEQTTSEAVSKVKAQIMQVKGKNVIDFTAGFGVDSFAFSKAGATSVIALEQNIELSYISSLNAQQQGLDNITFIPVSCLDYLDSNVIDASIAYIDPSRRTANGKVFKISDLEPDILHVIEKLKKQRFSGHLWVKLSPLVDVTFLNKEFALYNPEIFVLGLEGEVKEVLIMLNLGNQNITIEPNLISAIDIYNDGTIKTNLIGKPTFKKLDAIVYSRAEKNGYVYIPNAVIIKAGLSFLAVDSYFLKPVNKTASVYYASDKIHADGFSYFLVKAVKAYKPKNFAVENKDITGYHIIAKQFKLSSEDIRKRHSLKMGTHSSNYLIFYVSDNEENMMLECVK